MRRESELEIRLRKWAAEYHLLGDVDSAPASSACSVILGVQEAVLALEMQPHGTLPGMVLRCQYTLRNQPVSIKLRKLRTAGFHVSNASRYSQLLRDARIHVAAWLHIPMHGDAEEMLGALAKSPCLASSSQAAELVDA
jgi:hypothetical protein